MLNTFTGIPDTDNEFDATPYGEGNAAEKTSLFLHKNVKNLKIN